MALDGSREVRTSYTSCSEIEISESEDGGTGKFSRGGNLELTLGIDRMKKVLNKEALSISLEAKEESNETMGGSEEVEER